MILLAGLLLLSAVAVWTGGGSAADRSAPPPVAGGGSPSAAGDDPTSGVRSPAAPPSDAAVDPADEPAEQPDGATDPAAAPPATTVDRPTAIVPVTQFRSTRTATNGDQVAAILTGTSTRYDALELVAGDADAILAALGLSATAATAGPDQLVLAEDAATVTRDLAGHRKRLAFLRAEDVTPGVRALAWEGVSLFGSDRIASLDGWPLVADLPASADAPVFDPAGTWTLFAAGDIMLDRGVYETVRVKKKGVDFPFDGGTAEITGHCKDCSPLGWDTPYTKRTGNRGAMRDLIDGADLAIANFENPAPDAFRWHTKGTIFSADPGIIKGVAAAGFDWVGLANNHIGDQGRKGVLQTIQNVERYDLAHAGAGKDAAAARTPSMFEFGETKVAILAYDAIYKPYHATSTVGGSAAFSVKNVTADVKKARKAGADVVIVFPHWGIEYRYAPTPTQRTQAHAIIDAGADMIIGNHAHYAAAMEAYKGKPIWYALGNFVFDQTWSEPTMEGITLELTFDGSELAQARLRPHLILDKAQPNLLDPAGDGRAVLDPIWKASKGLLPW
jgi:Bacterial capsule synthesis protein PGA_cap